jgi:hypothetical protein
MYWGRSVQMPSVFFWLLCEYINQSSSLCLSLLPSESSVSNIAYRLHPGRPLRNCNYIHFFVVWDSFAQSAAREGTPSHAEMVRKLDALVDNPSRKRVLHIRFREQGDPPLACIEAPVTELDICVVKDFEVLAEWERRAESIGANLRAAQLEGALSMTCGKAVGDALTSAYLCGWNSVEVRCFSFVGAKAPPH